MSLQGKRIFTCTPVAFHGNDFFFSRDTGLICMNLRKIGAESLAVMPLPFHEDDIREDIIRVPMEQLKSPDWWRTLKLDGVVLYSWGAPRYTAIARPLRRPASSWLSTWTEMGISSTSLDRHLRLSSGVAEILSSTLP